MFVGVFARPERGGGRGGMTSQVARRSEAEPSLSSKCARSRPSMKGKAFAIDVLAYAG